MVGFDYRCNHGLEHSEAGEMSFVTYLKVYKVGRHLCTSQLKSSKPDQTTGDLIKIPSSLL